MTLKTLDKILFFGSAIMFLYDIAKRAKGEGLKETAYLNPTFDSKDVFGGYDMFKSISSKKKTS